MRDEEAARRQFFTSSRSDEESVQEDIARYIGADQSLHAADLEAVCRTVAATLESRADRARVLAWQDPRSPEAEALWLARVRKNRESPSDPGGIR